MTIRINQQTVRALRTKRGWTQEHLANLIGRSSRTVQRLERSGSCNLETRSALAAVLEVDVSQIDCSAEPVSLPASASRDTYTPAPTVPMSAGSLFAYANGHPRPNDLLHAIAKRRSLEVSTMDSECAYLNEQVAALHIQTVRELDDLVARHAGVASRISDYLRPEGPVDVAFVLTLVLDIAVIEEGGLSRFIEYREALRFSSGGKWWAQEIFKYYTEILAYG